MISSLNSKRILIVEDDDDRREALGEELKYRHKDWQIQGAASFSSAIEAVRSQLALEKPIAVVLTDWDLNEGDADGVRLVRELQSIDPLTMCILYTRRANLVRERDIKDLPLVDLVIRRGKAEVSLQRIDDKIKAALRYRSWAVEVSFLLRYFDPRLLEAVKTDPTILKARNRDVTIVFWDIRGFSMLCDSLRENPELVAGFLKEHCEMVGRGILHYGGFVDKFVGDGAMALFGVLAQDENGKRDAALNAVRAAKAVHAGFPALVEKWSPSWRKKTGRVIKLGMACGIHTGNAVVGNMGTEFCDQFTAVGPHVNFAQRLESIAGKEARAEILISQTTHAYLEDEPEVRVELFRSIDDVKNIPGEYSVYAVHLG
jgi:class 3 adenylate cyclase